MPSICGMVHIFGDLDWPLKASRGFVSISWACCTGRSSGWYCVVDFVSWCCVQVDWFCFTRLCFTFGWCVRLFFFRFLCFPNKNGNSHFSSRTPHSVCGGTSISNEDLYTDTEVFPSLVRHCGTRCRSLSVTHLWRWRSSAHIWRLFCFAEHTVLSI